MSSDAIAETEPHPTPNGRTSHPARPCPRSPTTILLPTRMSSTIQLQINLSHLCHYKQHAACGSPSRNLYLLCRKARGTERVAIRQGSLRGGRERNGLRMENTRRRADHKRKQCSCIICKHHTSCHPAWQIERSASSSVLTRG